MQGLYDNRPIVTTQTESYVSEAYLKHGLTAYQKMTKQELENELARSKKEIERIQSEIDESDGASTFVLKDMLQNEKQLQETIESLLETGTFKESATDGIKTIDDMIMDLDKKYRKGSITKEYRDKMIMKLNSKRALFDYNTKEHERCAALKAQEEFKKKHPIQAFKQRFTK